jgi:hypothetical protein
MRKNVTLHDECLCSRTQYANSLKFISEPEDLYQTSEHRDTIGMFGIPDVTRTLGLGVVHCLSSDLPGMTRPNTG